MTYPVTLAGDDSGTIFSDAAEWVRDQWAGFVGWESRLVDLQHRAALAAGNYRSQGDQEGEAAAKAMISTLGELNVAHGKLVDHMHEIGGWVGLGAIAVPVAIAAAFSALAVAMLWWLRKADLQEELLAQLEAGTLTEAGYLQAQAAVGAPPPLLAGLGAGSDLVKWLAVGLVAYVVLQALGLVKGFKRNPPLAVFHANPPGLMSSRVWGIAYRHQEDAQDYYHEFGPNVEMEAQEDGSVVISHRTGRPVWEEF